MAIFEREAFCPYCDDIMDIYGDHALVCPCGGDRTKRHNLLRNRAAHFCSSFALRPEVEKPGLWQKDRKRNGSKRTYKTGGGLQTSTCPAGTLAALPPLTLRSPAGFAQIVCLTLPSPAQRPFPSTRTRRNHIFKPLRPCVTAASPSSY